ncbi:integrase domain-containing protein [Providencia sneebia]
MHASDTALFLVDWSGYMARKIKPLSPTAVANARAKSDNSGKLKDTIYRDGDGLELLAKVSGSRRWYFRYYKPITQNRTMIGLGEYPSISLANARRIRDEYKVLLAQKIDPVDWCKQQSVLAKEANANTLRSVAEQWLVMKKTIVSENYIKNIWRGLDKYVLVNLGDIPVSSLKRAMLVAVLKPVEAKGKHETVRYLTQRTVEIMEFAMNLGLVDANPFTSVHKVFIKADRKHHPTIRPEKLPELIAALSIAQIELPTRLLIEWQLLTAVRPGEAAKTRWSEIDIDNKVWVIPPETMKMKRAHTVPLSQPALDILKTMHSITGSREFVFTHRTKPTEHMSTQTANQVLKRIGYKGVLTSHGIRSIVSTAMNEAEFIPDAIEAVLAHGERNMVRAAYNRATYLEQRIEMMDWWGRIVKQASQDAQKILDGVNNAI